MCEDRDYVKTLPYKVCYLLEELLTNLKKGYGWERRRNKGSRGLYWIKGSSIMGSICWVYSYRMLENRICIAFLENILLSVLDCFLNRSAFIHICTNFRGTRRSFSFSCIIFVILTIQIIMNLVYMFIICWTSFVDNVLPTVLLCKQDHFLNVFLQTNNHRLYLFLFFNGLVYFSCPLSRRILELSNHFPLFFF